MNIKSTLSRMFLRSFPKRCVCILLIDLDNALFHLRLTLGLQLNAVRD